MSSTRVNEEARSGFIHRTFWWFASYRASFWILAVWFLMIAVWVVPFQVTGQPAETLERIGWQWAPMRVVYAFMAVALVLCTYSRLTRDWEKVRARNLPKQPPSASVVVELMSLDDLSGQLEKRGYDVERQTDRLHAVKNRFAPLGGS
ncbi:MAG: hypothetical protein OEV43_05950, partial [Coriobacteriia bacterium]|nr:hypothetical protein [Coriobacteriia bacterium]